MTDSRTIRDSPCKSMTPNFVVFASVLLPIYCHIGSELPYMFIFVEDDVALLGAMPDKWAWTLLVCGQN